MYTLEEIAALRQKCSELHLEGREVLDKYGDEEQQTICNGIGPRGVPLFLRKALNRLHPALEPAALIHDVDFEESDGTEENFIRANDRFFTNGSLGALNYAWYDPRRYAALFQAYRLSMLCRHFGIFCWHLGALRNGTVNSGKE